MSREKNFEIQMGPLRKIGQLNRLMYVRMIRKYDQRGGEHFRIDVNGGITTYSYPKHTTEFIKRDEAIELYEDEVDKIIDKYLHLRGE